MNVLYFMSLMSAQDSNKQLQPRTYSTPYYRDVEIRSYAYTEARFLLWGVYFGVEYMAKYLRFYEVSVELFWEERLVGKIKILAPKRASNLGGGATMELVGQAESDGSGNDDTGVGLVAGNVADTDPVPLNASAALSRPPVVTVHFAPIAGAVKVRRNDLFLCFYSAFLQVAQYPVGSPVQDFDTAAPNGKLSLHVQDFDLGCRNEMLIGTLLYVPTYMLEHKEFGFRETEFVISLGKRKACVGTILHALASDERRSLEGSRLG